MSSLLLLQSNMLFPKVLTRAFSSTTMVQLRARALIYTQYGEPIDVLKVHSYELPQVGTNQLLLQHLAAPINPSDINQVQGVYPSKPPLTTDLGTDEPAAVGGNEGVFQVLEVGSGVEGYSKGDWVIPADVNYGTWRTHSVADSSKMLKLPKEKLSLNQAATIAVNPCSAYQMLNYYESLKPGDWFIQNAGNSQVGRAAIQIGKKMGLNSISIVRNRDNLQELVDELTELGATHVITEEQNESREFGATIKSWTKGSPIKLGLNAVGGSNCTALARKLANDATLLTYGGMSMKPVIIPTGLLIFKNLNVKGFWVTANIKRIPNSRQDSINEVIKLMDTGAIVDTPNSDNFFELKDSDESLLKTFQTALTNSKKGKQIVLFE
ncbi:unnamed protein product [Kuraishia capsulata CBS 1993]|uniref:enoyl-[acyl-carrier-protein] reductase n=1 Tax=Kuraishia capsulata CBS 1993 TaxID=1382522 RepID=W6MRA2_9ASCO|nr:uncharacterized protein KUCA_T00004878001 [Kuraishia capsulata CBS 1993]CDK28893.1 unnamed protein product [Kuraishia capsulata CBS 1993]